MDEMTLTLNSPITEEQWDMIEDVDFDHTDSITFYTKHGKEVEFVKRKTGKWERHNTYHGDDVSGFVDPDWRCSECDRQANVNAWCMYDLTDFCPHCGARMVQKGEDNDRT